MTQTGTRSANPAGNCGMVFACLGGVFLVVTLPVASLLRNPPAGYLPPGYRPAEGTSDGGGRRQNLTTPRRPPSADAWFPGGSP